MENKEQEITAPTIIAPPSGGRGVHVFAPATVANVVCGFDVLGFAVNEPGDEVIMRLTSKPGITISQPMSRRRSSSAIAAASHRGITTYVPPRKHVTNR